MVKMKKLSTGQLALTFSGAFLGAGYVSGQELYQFFAAFGKWGLLGFPIAILSLAVSGFVLIDYSRKSGQTALDKVVIAKDIPWLRKLVAFLQILSLLSIITIILAGAGALVTQLFGIPAFIGSLVLAVLAFLVALFGLSGMISAFSVLVPIISAATVAFCIAACVRSGTDAFTLKAVPSHNKLIPNWFVAAFTYAGYNMFASIGIFTPLGSRLKSKRSTLWGIILGSFILMLIAFSILIPMCFWPETTNAPLPMLALAESLSRPLSIVYGILLLGGMFGTTVASMVAITTYIKVKYPKIEKHNVILLMILTIISFILSLFGFGNLIGTIDPIFGYLSFVFLLLIICNYIKLRKKEGPHKT